MQDSPRVRPSPGKPAPRRRKKRQSDLLLFLFFLLFPIICVGTLGFALYRAGYVPSFFASNLTATSVAQNNASCQTLIARAMDASSSFCSQIGSNKACYGNNTIKADLVPGTVETFSTRGDVVDVDKVKRLSASPLKLDSNEWGVAVLKVIANLPRSLPGQTVTMVVFGNTTLDNNSSNLESFFFSSELGQIVCSKVPDDGIMIKIPDGGGVRFNVNSSELTLTGDAFVKAAKNGKMEISLFAGSGRIVSQGQEQYFGAGQKVSVDLGGENGTTSVSAPSAPTPLSQNDLDTACALTGQFCSQGEITPVPADQAQQSIQAALGLTPSAPLVTSSPSPTQTSTITLTPSPTQTFTRTPIVTPTQLIFVFPTWTHTQIPTKTKVPSGGNNSGIPKKTPTRTRTPGPSDTPGGPTPYQTPTFTSTPSPTSTPDMWSDPGCSGSVTTSSLTASGNLLAIDLTNEDLVSSISVDGLNIVWDVATSTKMRDEFLGLTQIGNANATTSPTFFPVPNPFNGPAGSLDLAPGSTVTLTINFEGPTTGSPYIVRVHFNIPCQVSASIP